MAASINLQMPQAQQQPQGNNLPPGLIPLDPPEASSVPTPQAAPSTGGLPPGLTPIETPTIGATGGIPKGKKPPNLPGATPRLLAAAQNLPESLTQPTPFETRNAPITGSQAEDIGYSRANANQPGLVLSNMDVATLGLGGMGAGRQIATKGIRAVARPILKSVAGAAGGGWAGHAGGRALGSIVGEPELGGQIGAAVGGFAGGAMGAMGEPSSGVRGKIFDRLIDKFLPMEEAPVPQGNPTPFGNATSTGIPHPSTNMGGASVPTPGVTPPPTDLTVTPRVQPSATVLPESIQPDFVDKSVHPWTSEARVQNKVASIQAGEKPTIVTRIARSPTGDPILSPVKGHQTPIAAARTGSPVNVVNIGEMTDGEKAATTAQSHFFPQGEDRAVPASLAKDAASERASLPEEIKNAPAMPAKEGSKPPYRTQVANRPYGLVWNREYLR